MKINVNFYGLLLVLLIFTGSCDQLEHGPYTQDGTSPESVSNLQFTPIYGGFDITYDLPANKDVLFVEAFYKNTKGERVSARTSAFNNSLTIKGFGDVNEKQVELYTVDRSGNTSESVSFTGVPLEPVVEFVADNSKITPTFGGAKFTWVHDSNDPIVLEIYAEDEKGELNLFKEIYTEQGGSFNIRGLEAVPQAFKMRIRDRYDNFSGFIFPDSDDQKITPIEEVYLDKSLFQWVRLDNDSDWEAFGFKITMAWDDDLNQRFMIHTPERQPVPIYLTIDLGVEVSLSRFKLYHRGWPDVYLFGHGNLKDFNFYGSLEAPNQDGSLDGWTKLLECHSVKPSGLPYGQNSDADRNVMENGEEWEFPADNPVKIRYVRLEIFRTWGNTAFAHIRELSFWGSLE